MSVLTHSPTAIVLWLWFSDGVGVRLHRRAGPVYRVGCVNLANRVKLTIFRVGAGMVSP